MPKDYTDAIDALIADKQKDLAFMRNHDEGGICARYEWEIMGMVEAKAAIVKTWRGKQEFTGDDSLTLGNRMADAILGAIR